MTLRTRKQNNSNLDRKVNILGLVRKIIPEEEYV